jgi:predicted transcriptional regulator
MSKSLEDVLLRAKAWPEAARKALEQLALDIDSEVHAGEYVPSPDEIAGISRGLSDVRAGRFVSEADVEAVFRKYRSS